MGAPKCLQVCRVGQEQISAAECSDCPPGKTSSDDAIKKCVECERGTYAAVFGARYCERCPAGRTSNGNRTGCDECPRNYYALDGAKSCVPCGPAEYSEPGSPRCTPCVPGEMRDEAGERCIPCGPGFQRQYHENTCRQCTSGKFSILSRSAVCKECEPGKRAADDRTHHTLPCQYVLCRRFERVLAVQKRRRSPRLSSRCYSCLPGTQFAADGYTCNACPAGSERPHTSKECSPCKPGMVSPSESTAYCEPCPAGTYSNANATGCIECPRLLLYPSCYRARKCIGSSSYCPRGSSAPIVTMASMYTNVARTSIKNCEPGYYCINGKKMPCPKNTFGISSNLTSATCDGPCSVNVNQYNNESSLSCSCRPTFVNLARNASGLDCQCPRGTYRSGAVKCESCQAGRVQPSNGVSSECNPCSWIRKSKRRKDILRCKYCRNPSHHSGYNWCWDRNRSSSIGADEKGQSGG